MIDITKEEFWNNNKKDIYIRRKKSNKLMIFVDKNKWIVLLITSFILLAISNGLLIYNFFRIISKLSM